MRDSAGLFSLFCLVCLVCLVGLATISNGVAVARGDSCTSRGLDKLGAARGGGLVRREARKGGGLAGAAARLCFSRVVEAALNLATTEWGSSSKVGERGANMPPSSGRVEFFGE